MGVDPLELLKMAVQLTVNGKRAPKSTARGTKKKLTKMALKDGFIARELVSGGSGQVTHGRADSSSHLWTKYKASEPPNFEKVDQERGLVYSRRLNRGKSAVAEMAGDSEWL